MPLEATMMIIDNSEFMRNGDYAPTRWEAQSDAVNVIFNTKIDSNPENTVGIMTMAGKGPEVLVTHTKDLGQVLKAVHDVSEKISGSSDIPTAVAIAQLALKHRENKNLRQRIIVFAGSPLMTDQRDLVKLAKKLKKNNVALDVISFGDGLEEGEDSPLKSFVEGANSGDNSHIIAVPPGTHLISDAVLNSPILSGDRGIPEEAMGDAGPSAAGGNQFEFGVDPSLDPELAAALRMSMEEEAARQAALRTSEGGAAVAPSSSAPAQAAPEAPAAAPALPAASAAPATSAMDEEDAELARALAMSQDQETHEEDAEGDIDMGDEDEEDEEEAIRKAIEMSMKGDESEKK